MESELLELRKALESARAGQFTKKSGYPHEIRLKVLSLLPHYGVKTISRSLGLETSVIRMWRGKYESVDQQSTAVCKEVSATKVQIFEKKNPLQSALAKIHFGSRCLEIMSVDALKVVCEHFSEVGK